MWKDKVFELLIFMISKKTLFTYLFVLIIFKAFAQPSVLKVSDSLLRTGDYTAALKILENGPKSSAEVLKKIADIYEKTGNYSEAIAYLEEVYRLRPSLEAKEKLGRNYQYNGNTEKAISYQQEVLEKNPDNLLLAYNLSKLYLANRQTPKAVPLLKKLIAKDPTNPNYPYQLGQAFDKIKKDPTAYYLRSYQLDSTHIKSIYGLAKYYKTIKVRDSSGIFIDKGLALSPKNLNFLQLKAQHEFLAKNYDSTLVYLKKLEEQKFETPFVLKLFGLTYYNLRDYEKALAYFKKTSRKDISDHSLYYNMGLCFKEMGEFKNANFSFMRFIHGEKPKVDKAYYQLALMEIDKKEYERAIGHLKKGYDNNKRNHLILFDLAMVSDKFYKDKKIALNYFEDYLLYFEKVNEEKSAFAKSKVKEIKKHLFINAPAEN